MNTKTYKQAFIVLAVGMFIVPQVAFAAWWNPFSWNIFQGADTKIQKVEAPINELESRVGNSASSTVSENKENTQKLTNEAPKISNASWWNPLSWNIFKKSSETSEIEKLRNEVEELKKKTAASDPTVVGDKSKATTKPATPTSNQTISVSELKKQAPQEYKALVNENKTQLLEASKLLSNKNIIARVKPSVVYIETTTGSGSGVVVGADGYILTNAHVVSGANSATVKLSNGGSFSGIVIGRDENIDLALLKINATGLSAAFLGDSDSVEQGDSVFTFGYPLGIEGDVAFKDGTLSRRQKIDGTTYLEISAQILPGNSGGPLVNQSGEVIGINTLAIGALKISGVLIGETLKFAMPINVAKNLIPDLKNGRNVVIPKLTLPAPKPYTPPTTINPAPTPTPNPSQPQPTPIVPPTPLPVFTPAPTVNLSVDKSVDTEGSPFVLNWSSTNATSCSASWTTSQATTGSQTVSPAQQTTTYSITCSGVGGNVNSYVIVKTISLSQPTSFFSASGGNIGNGGTGLPIINGKYVPLVVIIPLKSGATAVVEMNGKTYPLDSDGIHFYFDDLAIDSTWNNVSPNSCTAYEYTLKLSYQGQYSSKIVNTSMGGFCINNMEAPSP